MIEFLCLLIGASLVGFICSDNFFLKLVLFKQFIDSFVLLIVSCQRPEQLASVNLATAWIISSLGSVCIFLVMSAWLRRPFSLKKGSAHDS
jgi:hypothetical protein